MELSSTGKTSAIFAAFFAIITTSAANADPDPQCYDRVDSYTVHGKVTEYNRKPIHVDVKWQNPLKSGSEVEFDAGGSTVPSGKMESEWTSMNPDFKLISGSKADAVKKYKVPDRDVERDLNGKFQVTDIHCGFSKEIFLVLKVTP
jgi:hypothetical protein